MPSPDAAPKLEWKDLTADEKIERLCEVVGTLSLWLVEAQTGYGQHDHRTLMNVLHHGSTVVL